MTCIICFVSGVQLICMGVMGEYIGKIYLESSIDPDTSSAKEHIKHLLVYISVRSVSNYFSDLDSKDDPSVCGPACHQLEYVWNIFIS